MPKTLGRHVAPKSRTTNNTSTPLAGMEKNNQGGYSHVANHWERAERFLIIGTEGGTFYASEEELTIKSANAVRQCIAEDADKLVGLIARVSAKGLAVKQDAVILALALVFAEGNDAAKLHAKAAFRTIIRTGYHLLRFVETVRVVKNKPGLGRSLRGVISNWFESMEPSDLFYQLAKYQNRAGFRMGDIMALVHPTPVDNVQRKLFGFATKGFEALVMDNGREKTIRTDRVITIPDQLPENVAAYIALQRFAREVSTITDGHVLEWVTKAMTAGVPREVLPPDWLERDAAWRAQAAHMPVHALIRNVATFAAREIIPQGGGNSIVSDRLRKLITDENAARKARVHPFAVLIALKMYASGKNRRGAWVPNRMVLELLEELMIVAAGVQEPTGKRILYACDTSGSMQKEGITGNELGINCAEVGALLAYIMTRSEPNSLVVGFNEEVTPWNVTKRTSLGEMQTLATAGGGTDCSVAITWATEKRIPLDAIVLATDNETTGGKFHTSVAMAKYRREVNPNAKLICAALSADKSTIVDPKDVLGLNVCGMSADAGAAISAFVSAGPAGVL